MEFPISIFNLGHLGVFHRILIEFVQYEYFIPSSRDIGPLFVDFCIRAECWRLEEKNFNSSASHQHQIARWLARRFSNPRDGWEALLGPPLSIRCALGDSKRSEALEVSSYFSILMASCVMWSAVLDSSGVLLLVYPLILLAYKITTILISTLF